MRLRDGLQKERQKKYFDAHHGCLDLQPMQREDRVSVWGMKRKPWQIPGVVMKVINSLFYVVKQSGGGQIRRNRQQLQAITTTRSQGLNLDLMGEDELGEGYNGEDKEQVRDDWGGEQMEEIQKGQEQEQIRTTRSGRRVREPGWKKDYVFY